MKKRFPFILNIQDAKKIIQIACCDWKKTLIDKWLASQKKLNEFIEKNVTIDELANILNKT